MNITTSHIASNSGFRTKHVKVTYDKLRESMENLGKVPVEDDLYYRGDHDHFVASTLQQPVPYRDRPSQDLMAWNPVLDGAGKPVVETVTETIAVPGAKAEALRYAGGALAMGGAVVGVIGLAWGLVGLASGALIGQAGMFSQAFCLGAGASALLLAPGLLTQMKDAKTIFSGTNTLSMDATPIVKKELKGYDVSTGVTSYARPYIRLRSRLEETHLGTWQKPTVHSA